MCDHITAQQAVASVKHPPESVLPWKHFLCYNRKGEVEQALNLRTSKYCDK